MVDGVCRMNGERNACHYGCSRCAGRSCRDEEQEGEAAESSGKSAQKELPLKPLLLYASCISASTQYVVEGVLPYILCRVLS